jgi:hypothetical protein
VLPVRAALPHGWSHALVLRRIADPRTELLGGVLCSACWAVLISPGTRTISAVAARSLAALDTLKPGAAGVRAGTAPLLLAHT